MVYDFTLVYALNPERDSRDESCAAGRRRLCRCHGGLGSA